MKIACKCGPRDSTHIRHMNMQKETICLDLSKYKMTPSEIVVANNNTTSFIWSTWCYVWSYEEEVILCKPFVRIWYTSSQLTELSLYSSMITCQNINENEIECNELQLHVACCGTCGSMWFSIYMKYFWITV